VTLGEVRCRLSVLLVTYNQERYIGQALRSLFGQIIDGPVEVIVADDASSDRTLDIIADHEGRDPRFRFTYLDHSANLGITRNYERGFAACTGEYVAVLEGDDYWVSPRKLQRQYDFLEAHWECDLCAVNYFIYEEERAEFTPRITPGDGHRFLGARNQIAENLASNFSTCMYRREALEALPAGLFDATSYDWIVNICIARTSLIGFLEEPMSVYRLHAGGVWTRTSYPDQLRAQLDAIPAYDALTDHVYHSEFGTLANRLRTTIAASHNGSAEGAAPTPQQPAPRRLITHMPPSLLALARALIPESARRALVRMFCGESTTP